MFFKFKLDIISSKLEFPSLLYFLHLYSIFDNIIESKLTITKGKKISTKDIEVYNSPTRKLRFDPDKEPAHNYEESMKVIGKVKEKTGRIEFTNHLVPETQEKTDTKKKGI